MPTNPLRSTSSTRAPWVRRQPLRRWWQWTLLLCLPPCLLLGPLTPIAARAASADSPPPVRIGFLVLSPLMTPPSPERQAFFDRLAELGYSANENLDVIYRSADWDVAALDPLARDLMGRQVDLIVAVTSEAAQAARRATRSLPILFVPSVAPQASGLVESMARPGGNLTGVSLYSPELGAKRLDLLHEAYPGIQRVAVLWNAANTALEAQARTTREAAKTLGLTLEFHDVSSRTKLAETFVRLQASTPDALIAFTDSRMVSYRALIAQFTLQHRLPAMFGLRRFVDAGGLLSYGPDLTRLFRLAAGRAAQLLAGAAPAALPVIQPRFFELVINLETARALGRPIAASILFRADKVVE